MSVHAIHGREDNAEAQALIDLAPAGLMHLDGRGRLLMANAAASEMLGRSLRSVTGAPLERVLYPDAPLFALMDRARDAGGEVSGTRLVLRGPESVSDPLDLRVVWQGETGFGVVMTRSARRVLTDAGGSIGAFAKVFGHEVKTPLAAISGAAQLLARAETLAEAGTGELLRLIVEEADRLGRVISRLTDLEWLSAPRFARVNVHEVLDRVIETVRLAQGEGVRFQRAYDPSLPEIMADPDHLHQAVLNLLRNAVEAPVFAGEARVVEVATAFALPGRLPGRRGGGGFVIRVGDNGAGLPGQDAEAALQPFFTTKAGGTGIGLSVVQDVVSAHGGVLDVSSRPGATAFSMILPLRRPDARPTGGTP
jgi:two-component system nitrogen regulation sensor histidine kinase GlnL